MSGGAVKATETVVNFILAAIFAVFVGAIAAGIGAIVAVLFARLFGLGEIVILLVYLSFIAATLFTFYKIFMKLQHP